MLSSFYNRVINSNLAKHSFWALSGNVISKGLSLLAAIIVARILGSEVYGEYGMIKNTLLYIAVFSTFGLGFTATKFVAQNKDSSPDRIRSIIYSAIIISLTFSGLMALMVLVFAKQLAFFLEDPSLTNSLRYTALVVVFNALATVQIGIMAGLKLFKITAKINIFVGIINFVLSIFLTFKNGLEGAIIALLITNMANCILNYIELKRILNTFPNREYRIFNEIKNQIIFSTPIALQESSFSISFWASNLVLVKWADYSQLGLHSAAAQWTAIILFIPSVLQNVMLSYLSESKSSISKEMQNSLLKRMLMINFTATFFPFLLCLALSPFIVTLYGESYKGLSIVLNIAMAATIFRCLVQVFIQEFIAIGLTWTLCGIRLGRDLLSLVLTLIFINQFKENAAALYNATFLIASAFCLTLMWVLYNKLSKSE